MFLSMFEDVCVFDSYLRNNWSVVHSLFADFISSIGTEYFTEIPEMIVKS